VVALGVAAGERDVQAVGQRAQRAVAPGEEAPARDTVARHGRALRLAGAAVEEVHHLGARHEIRAEAAAVQPQTEVRVLEVEGVQRIEGPQQAGQVRGHEAAEAADLREVQRVGGSPHLHRAAGAGLRGALAGTGVGAREGLAGQRAEAGQLDRRQLEEALGVEVAARAGEAAAVVAAHVVEQRGQRAAEGHDVGVGDEQVVARGALAGEVHARAVAAVLRAAHEGDAGLLLEGAQVRLLGLAAGVVDDDELERARAAVAAGEDLAAQVGDEAARHGSAAPVDDEDGEIGA
jgi:hypothetical protein